MSHPEDDTEQLVERAGQGDRAAREALLGRHRDRLLQLIAIRFDRRMSKRVDSSDIVQDALAEAAKRLDAYFSDPRIPFYPWLRGIALERLIDARRRHIGAARRSVTREEDVQFLPDHSAWDLAERLLTRGAGAAEGAARRELSRRVHEVLPQLDAADREVLVLRFLEELSTDEVASVLGVTTEAARSRLRRALERFERLFGSPDGNST